MQRRCRSQAAAAVAVASFSLLLLFGVALFFWRTVWLLKQETCDKDIKHAMWSWEFARRCCDVYPSNGEVTSIDEDRTYFGRREMKNGSAVYVKVTDFRSFLDKFLLLPPTFRVTLVSGMDDFGPVEIFSPNRFGAAVTLPISLAQFLRDPRLHAWFAQNYDLGCNTVTQFCLSDSPEFHKNFSANLRLLAKIHPLPLGVDLHTWADKGDMQSPNFQAKVCRQRKQLADATSSRAMKSFDAKSLSVVLAFSCVFKNMHDVRTRVRGELCHLLAASDTAKVLVVPSAGKGEAGRLHFWNMLQGHTFALAPPGAGLDTHRFWEILQLQSIPIVITSPLDGLYSQFPVLIVNSWPQAFNRTFLIQAKARIKRQFGLDGRGSISASSSEKLNMDYWVARVAAAKAFRNEGDERD